MQPLGVAVLRRKRYMRMSKRPAALRLLHMDKHQTQFLAASPLALAT